MRREADIPEESDIPKNDDTKLVFRVLALATFCALPSAVLCEMAIRQFFLPPSFERLRQELASTLSPIGWVLVGLTALISPIARRLMHLLRNRNARGGRLVGFAIGASVVQLPALLATMLHFFGASALPAAFAVALSTVVIYALYRQRDAD